MVFGRRNRNMLGMGRRLNVRRMSHADFIAQFERFFGRRFFVRRGGREFEPMDDDVESDDDAPDQTETELLEVSSVDLQIRENTKAHHTNEFDITDALVYDLRELLVVRRGQTFNVDVNFNRPYDEKKDDLRIVFQFGRRPLSTKGTDVDIVLSAKDVSNEWGAYILSKTGNSLKLAINTPSTIQVGKWSLKIDVVKRADNTVKVFRYEHKDPVYMLFNPWCKNDQVYMHEEWKLGEYVLNETGGIYAGSIWRAKPWVFGQFTGDVLDCILYLLDKSGLQDQARGNPVTIARRVSALVNSPDDSGILEGNWTGDYEGGTSPSVWTGSVAIFDEFYKSKRPVRFGQCWVFSGLLTTVCRALGIPARSVTNFNSAHDTDGSITIDTHYDHNGEELEFMGSDSVWNFHVWNDVWMARPELPSGYGGWQAIDATPQETSDGVYCMGPMPLLAIKGGELHLPYDGPFVFAEVNADRVHWKWSEDRLSREIIKLDKNSVGTNISTKRPKRDGMAGIEREDVTIEYKFPEGSEEQRAAIRRANLHSTNKEVYETKATDVTFDIYANPDTFMGDDIDVMLTIKNTSDAKRTINGTLALASMYYTGVFYKKVATKKLNDVTLEPKSDTKLNMKIDAEGYLDKLMDHCICRISCMCIVEETRQPFADLKELRLRKPHLTLKAPDTAKVGKTFRVDVTFENPLSETLTKCELRVEGPGIMRPTIFKQPAVKAKGTYVGSFEMTPVKPGDKEIVVYFNCNWISSVNASHPITVQ